MTLYTQIIRAAQLFSNQFIRMISEGSCDTEDWSNDAEKNSALPSQQGSATFNAKRAVFAPFLPNKDHVEPQNI